MTLEEVIKQIREKLDETDEASQLAEWDHRLCTEKAYYGLQLAQLKKTRGMAKLIIKKNLLEKNGKCSEAEVENEYYATREGQWDAYYSELLKHISPLISAIRYKREALK